MNRRTFITLLGGSASWPLAVRAQEAGRTYRLGFLLPLRGRYRWSRRSSMNCG